MVTQAVYLKEETWVSRSLLRYASNELSFSYKAGTQQGHAVGGHLSKPQYPSPALHLLLTFYNEMTEHKSLW